MPAKSTRLVKRPGRSFAELRNSTPLVLALHFALHLPFQLSPPHFPHSPSLCSRFRSTVQSNSDLTLDSTLTPETTPIPTPLLFTFCKTHHSTLQCTLHSTLQSILCFSISLSTSFHCTFPAHMSLPLHSIPQWRK